MSNSSLMKMPTMAVWASSIEDIDDFRRAIYADVEFIHSNDLVKLICFIYSASVRYLLNNPSDPERAQKAFDIAVELAKAEMNSDKIDKDQVQIAHTDYLKLSNQMRIPHFSFPENSDQ